MRPRYTASVDALPADLAARASEVQRAAKPLGASLYFKTALRGLGGPLSGADRDHHAQGRPRASLRSGGLLAAASNSTNELYARKVKVSDSETVEDQPELAAIKDARQGN